MPGIVPTAAITGYAFNSGDNTITIPIASLGITAAQAHATTGDFRVVFNAICQTVADKLPTITPAPTFFTLTKGRTLSPGDRVEVTFTGRSNLALNTSSLTFPADAT
jgi:hypothetical protein